MTWKTALGLVTVAVIGGAAAAGCSSSTNSPLAAAVDSGAADTGATSEIDAETDAAASTPVDAASCPPADESAFTPTYQAPVHKSACSTSQIAGVRKCLSDFISTQDPNTASCTPFYNTDASSDRACYSCVIRGANDESGPILTADGAHFTINQPGCVSLVANDPTGKFECVAPLQARTECLSKACAADCALASSTAADACANAALVGTCKPFDDAYQACAATASDDAGASNVCLQSTDFFQLYDIVVPLFCATSADGGDGG